MAHEASKDLKQLGQKTAQPQSPDKAMLERIPWDQIHTIVRNTCPEFTSLCPVTGQPDFATIVIDYLPNRWLVESKSIKLWLASFRNHADFHEACVAEILNTLLRLLDPNWIRVAGFFYPRGGIPIDVISEVGFVPSSLDKPALDMREYKGR